MKAITGLEGKYFGNWKVIKRVKGNKTTRGGWLCECQCDDKTLKVVEAHSLVFGKSCSCGCLKSQSISQANKRHNSYKLTDEYGIGYDSNGNSFYFDIEDYGIIKNYCWYVGKDKYVCSKQPKNKKVLLHRLVMEADNNFQKRLIIDHIDRNPSNCQKSNLRFCTTAENSYNSSLNERNTSGVTGVFFEKERNKWGAFIKQNGQNHNLGRFVNKKDAIICRLMAEKEYFGEFAPQRHLFEEYGI